MRSELRQTEATVVPVGSPVVRHPDIRLIHSVTFLPSEKCRQLLFNSLSVMFSQSRGSVTESGTLCSTVLGSNLGLSMLSGTNLTCV